MSKILDRPLQKSAKTEVSLNAFSFLFSEMIQYTQKRVNGIHDFERKLSEFGKHVGLRWSELQSWREGRAMKRETKMIQMLYYVNTTFWKSWMGKAADSLEKSTENEDEYMITDNDPLPLKFISVPKDLSQLNCGAFVAGMIEALLEGNQFPAKVTAHSVPLDGFPNRTTFLIKFDRSVIIRESQFEK